jgi:Ca2+/Na+ antiporter
MSLILLCLILSLGIILLSCELFTNGIENLGKELKLGDGVVGSIFSAVGTCLPETLIPIIAILFSQKGAGKTVDIGIGAILGAPFMLSTLAFFVTGLSALVFWKRRNTGMKMLVDAKVLARDIKFFIIVYSVSILSVFVSSNYLKCALACGLIGLYVLYVIQTVNDSGDSSSQVESLIIADIFNLKASLKLTVVEVLIALSGIIFGAEIFIENIQDVSEGFGVPAFVLSLIITPIATELPEKFNSIIWVSKKKDTLALGNITGAMVFQSCIPVSIGILATPWKLDFIGMVSALISIISAMLVYFSLKRKNALTPVPLLMGGVFYMIFIFILLKSVIP